MKVKFRQTTKRGCGSLSLANIFDDNRFTVNLDQLPGERVADLNKKLSDFGFECFVDTLFMTQKEFRTWNRLKIGHDILFMYSSKGMTRQIREGYAVPYLFTLANSIGRNPHMVAAVHSLSDGLFHIIDSCKDEIVVLSFPDLVKRFHIITVSIFRLWDEDHGSLVMLSKSELSHIFRPKS